MCCACGGGNREKCTDTNDGRTNSSGGGCQDYYPSTSPIPDNKYSCADTVLNDSDFNAQKQCCICDGGSDYKHYFNAWDYATLTVAVGTIGMTIYAIAYIPH